MNEQEKPERDAEVFVKGVKRRTRKKFTAEEKIRIVLEGMKRDVAVTELCRREGIPTAAYYSWTKDFMEGGETKDSNQDISSRYRGKDKAAARACQGQSHSRKNLIHELATPCQLFGPITDIGVLTIPISRL